MTSLGLNVASRRYSVTQLEERPFDREEENGGDGVNAEFDSNDRSERVRRDVVARTKLRDEMDDEFLNEVGAIGNARDEGGAGNFDPAKGQARTNGANKERGHAESDERKLPDAGGDGEAVGFAEV